MPRVMKLIKRPEPGLFLCLAAGLSLRCAALQSTAPLWTPHAATPVQAAYFPDAGAVILADEGRCTLYAAHSRRQTVLERRMVVQILNERGYSHANVVLPYAPGSRISHIQAETRLPDGRSLKVQKNRIFDTELPTAAMLYARQRASRFTMPGIMPGAVITYTWRITMDDLTLWPVWLMQREAPVRLSRYTLDLPLTLTPQWRMAAGQRPVTFNRRIEHNRQRLTWTATDIHPSRAEYAAPPGQAVRQMLRFSPLWAANWPGVAQWYLRQSDGHSSGGAETARLAAACAAATPTETLRRLFRHVQQRIRYLAVATTESGFTPSPADDVLRNSYGDCKDMVTALVALGRASGIIIHPVLLSTWPHGRIDSTLVTPYQFNHVIAVARLDDSTAVWMDPTEKHASFGQLPWYDQNRLALEVRSDGAQSRLLRTPAYAPAYHLSDRHWTVHIDEAGVADGRVAAFLYGAPAMELRRQLAALPPSEKTHWLADNAFGRFAVAVDPEILVENASDAALPLLLSTRFTSSHLLLKSQQLYTFFPDALSSFDLHRRFLPRQRSSGVAFKHPLRAADHITLHFPAAWRCLSETQGDTLISPFGRYQWRLERLAPDKVRLERFFDLTRTEIAVEAYPAFRAFLNDVARSEQSLLLFSPH